MDLLVETGPERFVALECRTAERVAAEALKGVHRLAGEYGARAVTAARVVCRTDTPYPLEAPWNARAVPLGGRNGPLAELAAQAS